MATVTGQVSGSPMIGNPIVYNVKAETYSSPVFHRVKVAVIAGVQGGNYQRIEMSSPANEGEDLLFDISSALCAVAEQYEYEADNISGGYIQYPYLQYYMEAWDEYMVNGVSHKSAVDVFPDGGSQSPLRALLGAYSDMDRLVAGESKSALRFTRKPTTSPEIVRVGDVVLRPEQFAEPVHSLNITRGPRSMAYTIASEGMQTIGNTQVYALPADTPDYYQLRFVNSLGVHETIGIRSLRKVNTNITTKQFTRARRETFGKFSRGISRKQNDRETWPMTSGSLDEAWASWFTHELLMTEQAWIKIPTANSSIWVACHIIAEEEVEVIDQEKGAMIEVPFKVQMDINGSLMSDLLV